MKIIKLFFLLVMFFFNISGVWATQTVFNVPSADITEKGHVFLQEEAQFNAWDSSKGDRYYWSTTYTAVGIGHNTEIDATLFNVGAPATQNISMGIGFKSAIPIPYLKDRFPKREFKFTVGSNVLIGLEGNGVGNWTYAHLSGRIPKLNTRLTAGVDYGGRQVFGENNVSALVAIEQPITKKASLLADWYSGTEHWSGYLIVGGSYALPKRTTIYAGYQIPNNPELSPTGFVIQISKIF